MTLTAARPSEALGAQWEHIDLDQRVWSIPGDAMKKGRAHRVPLSDAAVEVLERRASGAAAPDGGLVFPNPRGKPMDRSVPRRLVKRMGYNATAHGMRSTFADWCREVAKADAEARELALAHQIGNATTRAYARSDLLEPRRVLMQQWADFLAG
jgi:integrase